MPRYRKFHVKTVESHDINDMPDDFTRLMYVLLPLALCREGRGLDNTGWVRARLFPMRPDVTAEMVEAALSWYAERGMITRYEVGGRRYFCIPNETWHRYQGTTTKEAETNYPAPTGTVQTSSEPTPDPLPSASSTDSVCSTQYSDAHSDADATMAAPAAPPVPRNRDEWIGWLDKTKNAPHLTLRMIEHCTLGWTRRRPTGRSAASLARWGAASTATVALWASCGITTASESTATCCPTCCGFTRARSATTGREQRRQGTRRKHAGRTSTPSIRCR